jgi:hypothetical protein
MNDVDFMRNVRDRTAVRARRGSTLIEVGVSLVVLATASVVAVRAAQAVAGQRREAERLTSAALEAANLMERLHTLPFSEVTPEKLQTFALSPWCRDRLPEPRLAITMSEEREPAAGKRIAVTLDWRGRDGQRTPPVRLTAWRYAERETPP